MKNFSEIVKVGKKYLIFLEKYEEGKNKGEQFLPADITMLWAREVYPEIRLVTSQPVLLKVDTKRYFCATTKVYLKNEDVHPYIVASIRQEMQQGNEDFDEFSACQTISKAKALNQLGFSLKIFDIFKEEILEETEKNKKTKKDKKSKVDKKFEEDNQNIDKEDNKNEKETTIIDEDKTSKEVIEDEQKSETSENIVEDNKTIEDKNVEDNIVKDNNEVIIEAEIVEEKIIEDDKNEEQQTKKEETTIIDENKTSKEVIEDEQKSETSENIVEDNKTIEDKNKEKNIVELSFPIVYIGKSEEEKNSIKSKLLETSPIEKSLLDKIFSYREINKTVGEILYGSIDFGEISSLLFSTKAPDNFYLNNPQFENFKGLFDKFIVEAEKVQRYSLPDMAEKNFDILKG